MNDFLYDDPATRRGQLQRGRGLGARSARNSAEGGDLVLECVIADSRWDRQTEQRDSYLARLIHGLHMPLGSIERHLFGYDGDDEDEIGLALQVLALLPFVGRLDAVPILRRYAIEGRYWHSALSAIEWAGPGKTAELWDGLEVEVVARHDDDELAAHADDGWGPWSSWARTQPRIRRILDELSASRTAPQVRRPLPDDYGGISSANLLRRVGEGRGRRLALEELGRRGDAIVLDLAEDTGLRNAMGWTPGIPKALTHLGIASVARARTWTASGDGTLEDLAVGVLSEFGDRSDGPYLLNCLNTAASEGNWCATEKPARGLGRLGVAEAADALVHLWEATTHSYAREAVLEGLRGCAPETTGAFAVEGLDDCEPVVQQAACAETSDTTYVRGRLTELRDDPLAREIREAVQQRLTQLI